MIRLRSYNPIRIGPRSCVQLVNQRRFCLAWFLSVLFVSGFSAQAWARSDELNDQLAQAEQSVVLLHFRRAQAQFDALRLEAAEGSELWQKACYGLAVSGLQSPAVGRADVSEAVDLLQELLRKSAPNSSMRAFAYKTLGRIHHMRDYPGDPVDLPAAREAYSRVIEQFPDHPLAATCRFYRIQTYLEVVAEPESVLHGVGLVRRYAEGGNDKATTSILFEMAGDAMLRLERREEAVILFSEAYRLGLLDTGKTDIFLWRLGRISEQVEDWDRAVFAYQEMIRKTNSGRTFEAHLRLSELAKRFPEMNIKVPELHDPTDHVSAPRAF